MRVRNGFVTNSSSSSFIIGFKSEGIKEIEETLDKVPSIFKSSYLMFKKLVDFDNAITTHEELNKHFLYQYGWKEQTIEELLEEDEWLKEKYAQFLVYLVKGYGIVDMSVDYNDETLSNLLESLPQDDSDIILISHDY